MGITAVVFDWAGTVIDHGSRAPVAALQDVFETAGVPVSIEEVRISMGLAKRDHIRAILDLERVNEAWQLLYGVAPGDEYVDSLYADFVPKQLACLGDYSGVIAGVPEVVEELRSRGVMIGSTTGYNRAMLDFLLERAAEQGFAPDCAICPEDVPGGGRPAPWMCYLNAIEMAAAPLWTIVKIGDTASDIEEGINAGMWTIGVTRTGNEAGLTEEEWEATDDVARAGIIEQAQSRLIEAGAHYLMESVADLFDVFDEISGRIDAGERP
jgi:phosphonoacetaldehyde hydrolase